MALERYQEREVRIAAQAISAQLGGEDVRTLAGQYVVLTPGQANRLMRDAAWDRAAKHTWQVLAADAVDG